MADSACLICGSSDCKLESTGGNYSLVTCRKGYTFGLSDEIIAMPVEDRDRFVNLIFEHILREPHYETNTNWYFYFDPDNTDERITNRAKVNLANAILSYPNSFAELSNRTLINLSRLHPRFGDAIGCEYIDYRTAYCIGERAGFDGADFFDVLNDLGYLSRKEELKNAYFISANGWKKVEEIQKKENQIKQGFVAMSFRSETKFIRDAFKKAISESGFVAVLIDEKEHNNQIVPEIFYEIKRSKFMVVDVTYPNYGAYYEAGFAQGLGKEVIFCCSQEAFCNDALENIRPHFDISQKSMVIWKNPDDLVFRLKRRIEATVK